MSKIKNHEDRHTQARNYPASMRLRTKVLLILSCVLLINLLLGYYLQRHTLVPSFSQLEHEDALQNIKRCEDALRRELHHLNLFTNDWSAWDDTYAFVRNRNAKYIETNVSENTFTLSKLNLFSIYNLQGELVWGMLYDFQNKEKVSMPGFLETTIPGIPKLINHAEVESSVEGIVNTARGPLMLVSRPIITTQNEGPIRGALIMGRFLDDNMRTTIAEQTAVDINWWPVEGNALPAGEQSALAQITPENPVYSNQSDKQILQIYEAFPDINNRPGLLLKASIPRRIAARGSETFAYILISTFAGGVVTLMVILLLLQKIVLAPISRLTRHVNTFSSRTKGVNFEDLSEVNFALHGDEIMMLAQAFEKLEAGVQQRAAQLLMINEQLNQEIMDRKHSEEAARASEHAYRTLAENLPGIVYRIFADQQKRPQFFNRMLENMTGFGAHELKSSELCIMHSLILPEDRPLVQRAVWTEPQRRFIRPRRSNTERGRSLLKLNASPHSLPWNTWVANARYPATKR